MIDKILYLGVQGISDLIIKPGDINIDFADVKAVMTDSGTHYLESDTVQEKREQ